MAVPDYQSVMLPVLTIAQDGEIRVRDAIDRLADQLRLTPEDRALLIPSGKQGLFANRVHWARTYLTKAGLLELTRRGHFRITPRGSEILAANPARIDVALLNQFEEFREFMRPAIRSLAPDPTAPTPLLPSASETPDDTMRAAHRQIEAALAQDLLQRVCAAPPSFFEHLIVELLRGMGYGGSTENAGRTLGRSGDDGVDGVVDQDALGLDRVYIQAKRYMAGNAVGSGAIRDFFGSLDRHKASKGLFVTTSTFSSAAVETAELLSKRIVLIDGDQLSRLMIRYNVGCRIEETLTIKKMDEDFFE